MMATSNRKAFLYSIVVHIFLFTIIFFSFNQVRKSVMMPPPSPVQEKKIVEAVVVDKRQVDQAIQELRAVEEQKHSLELAKEKHLEQLAREVENKRKQEEVRLQVLEKKKLQMEVQRKAQKKAEQVRLEKLKQEQAKALRELAKIAEKKDALVKQKALEWKRKAAVNQQFEQALKKQVEQELTDERSQLDEASNSQMMGELDKYKSMIKHAISRRWVIPEGTQKTASLSLLIRLAPGGVVLDVRLLKSSGDGVLDRSAIAAVYKAAPLPVPQIPQLFDKFRELDLTMRPESIISAG